MKSFLACTNIANDHSGQHGSKLAWIAVWPQSSKQMSKLGLLITPRIIAFMTCQACQLALGFDLEQKPDACSAIHDLNMCMPVKTEMWAFRHRRWHSCYKCANCPRHPVGCFPLSTFLKGSPFNSTEARVPFLP